VFTPTIELGSYSLSALTDLAIKLRLVYKKILPSAPWDTTESIVWNGLLTLTWPELGYRLDVISAIEGSQVEMD
jgi:hypothetical protein